MTDIPFYVQRANAPGGVSATVQLPRTVEIAPAPAPSFEGVGADSRALVQAGHAIEGVAEKFGKAQDETRAAKARTDYLVGLEDLRSRYAADPDYQNAPQKFRNDATALQATALEGIRDDHLRETARLHMVTHAISAGRFVDQVSARREDYENRQMFMRRRPAYLKSAADAATPVERQAVEKVFDSDVDEQAAAGWISPEVGAGHKLLFRSDVSEGDANRVIAADPSAAIGLLDDPAAFPFLDPAAHARLTDAAYKAESAAALAPQAETEATAFRRAREGILDPHIAADDALPAAVQIRLAGMLQPPPPASADPRAFAHLMDRAVDDGRGALLAAADDYAAGRIDKPAFDRIYDTAQRFDVEIAERPFAIDARRDLIAALAPRDDGMPSTGRALHDATAAFDVWLDQNPDADAKTARAEMLRLADAGRAQMAAENRATLPLPRFADAAREAIDATTLAGAAARLRDAHATMTVSDDELIAQTELLRLWRGTVQATSKGGR